MKIVDDFEEVDKELEEELENMDLDDVESTVININYIIFGWYDIKCITCIFFLYTF